MAGAKIYGDGADTVIADIPFDARAVTHGGADEAMGPLIFNAWYVIAQSSDVGRSLKPIKVLGERLVYYRTEAGQAVVLDDRCPHRRYPLSKGRLVGDNVECGYHGFTYVPSGQCIWAPGVMVDKERDTKLAFGVRSYPCAERGPWLWVWMGNPELADAANIPLPDLGFPAQTEFGGYKLNGGNYLLLIENQLDLSHVHFLHGAAPRDWSSAVPEEAPAPAGGGVSWKKVVERTEASWFSEPFGEDPKRIVRQEDLVVQYAPSLTYGHQWRTAEDGQPVKPAEAAVFHAFTPMDERNTHQFYWFTFSDIMIADKEEFNSWTRDQVLEEDTQAAKDIQTYMDEDRRPGRVEFSMACDRFGLKMRRVLKEMKRRELDAL